VSQTALPTPSPGHTVWTVAVKGYDIRARMGKAPALCFLASVLLGNKTGHAFWLDIKEVPYPFPSLVSR
jgi:hypothetical protein